VGDEFVGRFEVFVFGGRNTLFSWSQMALVAPLDGIEGGVDGLVLEAGTGRTGNGEMGSPPGEGKAGKTAGSALWVAITILVCVLVTAL
jgi:hexosaminidase